MKLSLPLFFLFLSFSLILIPALASYVPHQGDTFSYYEVQNVNNGTGDYNGYTDQTVTNGTITINGITNDIAYAYYNWTSNWSDNQGDTPQNNASSGNFAFSSTSFLYTNGTDDQEGYVNPTVWFCMNSSLPQGSTFNVLNTVMTVISRNNSYDLPSQSRNVNTIYAQGIGTYQRDDSYGQFTAAYTWNMYFDPSSGYIVGYSYEEQDTNTSGTGFTLIDNLYITSESYSLTAATSVGEFPNSAYVVFIGLVIVLVIVVIAVAYVVSRKHSSQQSMASSTSTTNTAGHTGQIVKCPHCGAEVSFGDKTVTNCSYCGMEVELYKR